MIFTNDKDVFVKTTVEAQDDRTAYILNVQTEFAALDATTIRAYMLVVLRDDETGDGYYATVSVAGTPTDKSRMANALAEALEKGNEE